MTRQPSMSVDEYRVATRRLGLATIDVATMYGFTPHVVEAFEAGSVRIPARVAADLRWKAALAERDELLAASGLPSCERAAALLTALETAVVNGEPDDVTRASEATVGHAQECAICQAREGYLAAHAPALPEMPIGRGMRAFLALTRAFASLPPGIRPPEGNAGVGRQMGLFLATGLSLLAWGIIALAVVGSLGTRGSVPRLGELARGGSVVTVAYFFGFWLAGAAFDLLRPIRASVVGHALVGAIAAVAIYGSVGVAMPLLDPDASLRDVPPVTLFLAPVGAVAGLVFWVRSRGHARRSQRRAGSVS